MADGDSPSTRLVRRYIEAVQRARAPGNVDDFEALREFLAAGRQSRPGARNERGQELR